MTQFIYYTSALELEAETLGNKLENSGPQRAITVPGKGRSNSQLLRPFVQFFFYWPRKQHSYKRIKQCQYSKCRICFMSKKLSEQINSSLNFFFKKMSEDSEEGVTPPTLSKSLRNFFKNF